MNLVSAIVPVYNRVCYLRRALDSALSQTLPDIGIIVVDDGSCVPVADECAGYGDRVTLKRLTKHVGQNAARNAGIVASRSDFVAFLDSDDEWLPEKIEKQLSSMQQSSNFVFSGTRFYEVLPEQTTISPMQPEGNILNQLLRRNVVGGFTSLLVRRSALDALGCLDEELESSTDWDTAIRLAMLGDYVPVNEPLYRYHMHGMNIRNDPAKLWRGRRTFFRKYCHLMTEQERDFYGQGILKAERDFGAVLEQDSIAASPRTSPDGLSGQYTREAPSGLT